MLEHMLRPNYIWHTSFDAVHFHVAKVQTTSPHFTTWSHAHRSGGGGATAAGGKPKRSKQPLAQLVEVDIPGAPLMPHRAPVARDASVDPYIGRHIL